VLLNGELERGRWLAMFQRLFELQIATAWNRERRANCTAEAQVLRSPVAVHQSQWHFNWPRVGHWRRCASLPQIDLEVKVLFAPWRQNEARGRNTRAETAGNDPLDGHILGRIIAQH